MLFAAYAGRLSDRIGLRLPLVSGILGTGIALLLPYLFKDQLFILLIPNLYLDYLKFSLSLRFKI